LFETAHNKSRKGVFIWWTFSRSKMTYLA